MQGHWDDCLPEGKVISVYVVAHVLLEQERQVFTQNQNCLCSMSDVTGAECCVRELLVLDAALC